RFKLRSLLVFGQFLDHAERRSRLAGPGHRRLPPGGRRPARPIALAAYYVATEALANVAKHARAASARLDVSAAAAKPLLRLTDDGAGGADPDGGGLSGLRDRGWRRPAHPQPGGQGNGRGGTAAAAVSKRVGPE